MPTPIDITGGTLPITCYPPTPNELWAVMWPTLLATLNQNFPGIYVGATAPPPDMQDRLWFNTTNGQWYQFINGTWTQIPIEQQFLSFFLEYYAVDSGTANTLTIAFPARPLTAYGAGLVFWVKVAVSNSGATTLNVDTLGAVSVKKFTAGGIGGLVTGDLIAGGVYVFVHDGTQFVLINPTPPANHAFTQDDASRFNTRFGANPGAVLQFSHGLGVTPSFVAWTLVCAVADAGFSVNDEIDIHDVWVEQANDFEPVASSYYNASIVGVSVTPKEGAEVIVVNSGGDEKTVTAANWFLRVRAFVINAT